MSESVQLASLRPPQSGHASRTAQGGKDSSDGFDAALCEADGQHVPAHDSKAVPDKQTRQDDAEDPEVSSSRAGDSAAFLARLFNLDDRPADQRAGTGQATGKAVPFKLHPADDKAVGDKPSDDRTAGGKATDEQQAADGGQAAAPALALAASTAVPPIRGAAAEPMAGDKKPAGKAAGPIGDSTRMQKVEAAAGSAKDVAKIADAVPETTRKSQAVNVDPESGKDDAGRREASPLAKVKVVSAQSTPAPVAAQLPSPTVAALARAIHTGAASGAAAAHAAAAAAQQPPAPTMVHTLNIQLQPETLGTVTARLHLSGDNLRVDLHVDNADAHRRLRSDSDAIVKSLRALGYDVDKVTIQAPAPAQSAVSGHNAAAQGREQPFQQAAGNSANGQGSNHAGSGRENGQGASHQPMERQEQHSSPGGLFI